MCFAKIRSPDVQSTSLADEMERFRRVESESLKNPPHTANDAILCSDGEKREEETT